MNSKKNSDSDKIRVFTLFFADTKRQLVKYIKPSCSHTVKEDAWNMKLNEVIFE